MKYKIEKIKENIYKITEPYFYEHSNIFVFKGVDFDLIIDSGVGMENLNAFLKENNFIKTKIFITHSHFDHCGGIASFNYKNMIIKNKTLNNLKNNKLWAKEYLDIKDFDKKVTNKLGVDSLKFCKNFKVKNTSKIKPYDGNLIDNGIFSFKIIHAPGHTDDSYILFDKKNKILITGDTLYDGKVYAKMPNSNKKLFIKSLQNLQKIDFNLVLPGHNELFNKEKSNKIISFWIKELEKKE